MPDEAAPEGSILIYRDGGMNLRVRMDGETVWLTQKLIAELYGVTVQNISQHLIALFEEGELARNRTVKRYFIVQKEGSKTVSRSVEHYNLDAILAVGYRVRSTQGTAFRQWATARLSELLVKGFTLDDERIKAGRTLGGEYFDELLARIRDIRSSERLFYQKITDIYATSIDYDKNAELTKQFFATVQNKLHWAIHGHTAAEVVKQRANADSPNTGLTSWKNAPAGPVRKADVGVAKNYLTQEELASLNRIVSMYLDYAEDQAERGQTMTMADWIGKLDAFLHFNQRNVLTHAGKISQELASGHAQREFERYDAARIRRLAEEPSSDFDQLVDESRRLSAPPSPAKKARTKAGRKKRKSEEE